MNMGKPPTSGPRVVLVGTMGAGKSTVGALLAERWGTGFRDTDADIEAGQCRSVADIFVESGEPAFRELEREAAARALAEHAGVLALGGGAVEDLRTRELLRGHTVVYLRVGLADAAARIGLDVARPMLLGNVRGRVKSLIEHRDPLYREVAGVIVETDGRTPEQVATQVEALIPEASR